MMQEDFKCSPECRDTKLWLISCGCITICLRYLEGQSQGHMGMDMEEKSLYVYTCATASLAARAMMSAHETILGHLASTSLLMSLMTLNPAKVRLGTASFSAVLLGVESINTDASQPCTHHAQTCQEESRVQVSHVYSSTLNYTQKFYSTHHVQSNFFGFCIWSKQTHLKY